MEPQQIYDKLTYELADEISEHSEIDMTNLLLTCIEDKIKMAYGAGYNDGIKANFSRNKKLILQCDLLLRPIKTWDSATEAARANNTDPSSIIKNCRGKIKSSGGFIWKYA